MNDDVKRAYVALIDAHKQMLMERGMKASGDYLTDELMLGKRPSGVLRTIARKA